MPAGPQIVSLNAAVARTLSWRGHEVQTGIFKEPVDGPRMAFAEGLEGDRVVDRRYHGAPHQALYAYPAEHYPHWQGAFPALTLGWGAFGENLTTSGLDEQSVCIGDRFRAGEAELEVTQPRWPCFKLGRKLGQQRIVKQLLATGRTGFYLRVVTPGRIRAGDAVEFTQRDPEALSVEALLRLSLEPEPDRERMARATRIAALPEPWRDDLLRRLAMPAG